MMQDTHTLFFELLQVAVGTRITLSRPASAEEWEEIYSAAGKQSLLGIAFAAVERLPREQLPPPRRIRQWAIKADKLREHNRRLSANSTAVAQLFEKNGFKAVILKGQGNMHFYPEHLKELRNPGDIDVWAWPANPDDAKNPVASVIRFCQKKKKGDFVYYHNLDFPVLKDKTTIEVHYRPTWLFCPWRDRTLQRWFRENRGSNMLYDNGQGSYRIPTTAFNLVFQLLHMYKHIFEEGIGLRQLVDYHFILESISREPEERTRQMATIKSLGMERFAGAVMYVLREVLSIPDASMLCPPDERAGKLLLEEIMIGGNFGHHDDRYTYVLTPDSPPSAHFLYAIQKLRHNMRFLRDYPSEVLWEPPFRLFHWIWRTARLWRI